MQTHEYWPYGPEGINTVLMLKIQALSAEGDAAKYEAFKGIHHPYKTTDLAV